MQITIWRHGEAESHSSSGLDEDRVLSPEGRNGLIDVADAVFGDGKATRPKKIFTSPLVRAKESAETIQGFLGCPQGIEVLPQLDSGTYLENLVQALKKIGSLDAYVLFGHMPDLGRLADYLLGQDDRQSITLKAGGLIRIEIQGLEEPLAGKLLTQLNPENVGG